MPYDQYTIGGGRIKEPRLSDNRDGISREIAAPSFDDLLIHTPDHIKEMVNANRAGSLAAVALPNLTANNAETFAHINDEMLDLLPLGTHTLHGPYPTAAQGLERPTVVWILGVAPADAASHSNTIISDIGCDNDNDKTHPNYMFHLVAAEPSRESYMGYFVGLPMDASTDDLLTALKLALIGWINHNRASDQSITTISNKVDDLFYHAAASALWKVPYPPTPKGIRVYVPKTMNGAGDWNDLRTMLSEDDFVLQVRGGTVRKWQGLKCEECLSIDHATNGCEIRFADPGL
ncbi:hypothetical protein C8F01DRAFT_1281413 [Mycena amicta]|nr:hypothetical protein C8F01DRAFT_1281413 [Mycena amicta]